MQVAENNEEIHPMKLLDSNQGQRPFVTASPLLKQDSKVLTSASTFNTRMLRAVLPRSYLPPIYEGVNLHPVDVEAADLTNISSIDADRVYCTVGSTEELPKSQVKVTEVTETVAPRYIREKLLKQSHHTDRKKGPSTAPIIGFMAYVGSPVDEDILIGNPLVVDEWLTYIRAGQRRGLVDKKGLVRVKELEKLCNVTLLSGTRHNFDIKYDVHTDQSCAEHKHDKRIWESAAYPCTVTSCTCFDHN